MTDEPDALTAVIHQLRPDWDRAGIRTALTRALRDNPWPDVAAAAIAAANDPHARTPGVIPADGPHWHTTTNAQAAAQGQPNDPHCNHPPGECEHGAAIGHCALCRYPNGMPLEKRVSGPGREILRQGYAARAAGDVGSRPATAHVQTELTE